MSLKRMAFWRSTALVCDKHQWWSDCVCVAYRFLPDGTFLYRTSPEVLVKVERSLRAPFVRSRTDEGVHKGRYLLLVGLCLWLRTQGTLRL